MNEPKPVSAASADQYTWGQGCDGWHLVKTDQLSVIEERMPPGTSEIPHYHRVARQFFFVLRGTLTLAMADGVMKIVEGKGIEVAPGTIHEARNEEHIDARFLVVSQPPSHGDRVNIGTESRS